MCMGNDTRGTAKIKQALLSRSCERSVNVTTDVPRFKMVITYLGLTILIIKMQKFVFFVPALARTFLISSRIQKRHLGNSLSTSSFICFVNNQDLLWTFTRMGRERRA